MADQDMETLGHWKLGACLALHSLALVTVHGTAMTRRKERPSLGRGRLGSHCKPEPKKAFSQDLLVRRAALRVASSMMCGAWV